MIQNNRIKMNTLIVALVIAVLCKETHAKIAARICATIEPEMAKCEDFKKAVETVSAIEKIAAANFPTVQCVRGNDAFECMRMIQANDADLMNLDAGQGYFAGRYHNMMPVVAETYNTDPNMPLRYYSVGVVRSNGPNINIQNLEGKTACLTGIGRAAGWVNPVATLLKQNLLHIYECNAIVFSVTNFFDSMCLPGALNSFYNPFGNNPTTVCDKCAGQGAEKCTSSDPFAGYDGAIRCLSSQVGDVAFVRDNTIMQMAMNGTEYRPEDFRLICPNGQTQPVTEFAACNWGSVPAHIVMTSSVHDAATIQAYKDFFITTANWFAPGKPHNNIFNMFSSWSYRGYQRRNLLFTDGTAGLVDVGEKNSYYTWVDSEFLQNLDELNHCPIRVAHWCVTSPYEQTKCEDMIMALRAKNLRPGLDCVLTRNTDACMRMIAEGDADLMSVDAGDVYLGGRKYGLVPIMSEDYGDTETSYYVVAVAKKKNAQTTLFNLKNKRACLPGIDRGDGWIIPLNVFIETEQFLPSSCTIFDNLGQLFTRSCIPGSMDLVHNPRQYPLNLCEGCAAGAFRKCERSAEEPYYGATGAFRCLVENGGDIAFARHLTVRDNTDGRNHAIWSRNRRSDDYELMCKDGRRTNIDNWINCHLGQVPSNAIITGGHKTMEQREIYWNVMNYAQQFFSSDVDGDFHMFDSGNVYNDLLFNDDTVRLVKVDEATQNYKSYLGTAFIAQIENLHKYTCVDIGGSNRLTGFTITTMLFFIGLYKIIL